MSSYKLKVWNKHFFIENSSGLILLDTGSPFSFHVDGVINIGESEFKVPQSAMNISIAYLKEKVGCELSGLLGMDILSQFSVWFSSPQFGNTILFSETSDVTGQCIGNNLMGCPTVNMNVNGRKGTFLFDSGAHVSYISSKFLNGQEKCGTTTDFSPLLNSDRYEVDLYYFDSSIISYNKCFNAMYAKMPSQLEMLLSQFGVDGIIGFDLIDNYRLIVCNGHTYLPPQGI